MPMVDIRTVDTPSANAKVPSAQELADALGRAFGSASGRTWVRLHALPRDHYAENETTVDEADLPVFVTVLLAHLPDREAMATQVRTITATVAGCLARPEECVHVEYAPEAAGRTAFGGRLVE